MKRSLQLATAYAAPAFMLMSCSVSEERPQMAETSAVCESWQNAQGIIEEFDMESDTSQAMAIVNELWLTFALSQQTDLNQAVFAYGNAVWNDDADQERSYRRELDAQCARGSGRLAQDSDH